MLENWCSMPRRTTACDRPLKTMIATVNADVRASAAAVDAAEASARREVLACGIAAFVLTTLISLFIAGRIRNRLAAVSGALRAIVEEDLGSLATVMEALAAGDLTAQATSRRAPITARGNDEIAELTTSYNGLVERLAQIARLTNGSLERLSAAIADVAETAAAVALASTQVSGASSQASVAVTQIAGSVERVARGATDQAERIGSAGTAFEELARVAEQIAQGAAEQTVAVQEAVDAVRGLENEIGGLAEDGQSLAASASEADGEAKAGTRAVADTADAMRSMQERTTSAERAMTSLEERSNAVQEIIANDRRDRRSDELAGAQRRDRSGAGRRARPRIRGRGRRGSQARRARVRRDARDRRDRRRDSPRDQRRRRRDALRRKRSATRSGRDARQRRARGCPAASSRRPARRRRARPARRDDDRGEHGLARDMGSVSSVVEENAAAAGQMRTTAGSIAQTVAPITVTAQEQSRAAVGVGRHNGARRRHRRMSATANALLEHAQGLRRVVSGFRLTSAAAPL